MLTLAVLVPVVAAAGWGAWSLWRTDPLREARAALDRRDFRAADELLARRLIEYPDDAPTRLLAARAARRGGDLARAAEHLQRYRDGHGADDAFKRESAVLRARGGDLAESDRLFAAYDADAEVPDAADVMEAYLECKLQALAPQADLKPDAARADGATVANLLRAAHLWLRWRPGRADQVQGLVWLARALVFANDRPAGLAALREAVALDPEHFEARFQLALVLSQQDPDETRRHMEILAAQQPKNDAVRYGLATTYRTLGRSDAAREILTGLLTGPVELSALVQLALVDMDDGNFAAAEPRLLGALRRAPDSPEVVIAMSRCQQLAGRPGEAARYRKRFDELEARRQKPHPMPPAP